MRVGERRRNGRGASEVGVGRWVGVESVVWMGVRGGFWGRRGEVQG